MAWPMPPLPESVLAPADLRAVAEAVAENGGRGHCDGSGPIDSFRPNCWSQADSGSLRPELPPAVQPECPGLRRNPARHWRAAPCYIQRRVEPALPMCPPPTSCQDRSLAVVRNEKTALLSRSRHNIARCSTRRRTCPLAGWSSSFLQTRAGSANRPTNNTTPSCRGPCEANPIPRPVRHARISDDRHVPGMPAINQPCCPQLHRRGNPVGSEKTCRFCGARWTGVWTIYKHVVDTTAGGFSSNR